jgi:hypothetical protein
VAAGGRSGRLSRALAHEATDQVGQRHGLVLGDEGARVGDRRQARVGDRRGEALAELAQRTAAAAGASGTTDPLAELRVGAEAWLDACTEPRSTSLRPTIRRPPARRSGRFSTG